MNLINSTDYSDQFLKKMLKWICRQLVESLPVNPKPDLFGQLHKVRFTNFYGTSRGRAWPHRIFIRIGSENKFPAAEWFYHKSKVEARPDRICGLIGTTAHELSHVLDYVQYRDMRRKYFENRAVWRGNDVVKKFLTDREALIEHWSRERKTVQKPVLSLQDQRFNKIQISLDRWQRKMKLAQTKIRKLKARAHYYELRQAALKTPISEGDSDGSHGR
jgi:hypothetical protein